jgi:transcriptional regulator with GAF, ATPase, and Fis domain
MMHEKQSSYHALRTDAALPAAQPDPSSLAHRSWRNWILLAVLSIINVIGLGAAIPPLMNNRFIPLWPWAKTQVVLLAGLSLSVLIFIIYMTQQQRKVLSMQNTLQELQEKNNERTRRHYKRLFALLNMSRIMGSETDIQGIFDCITRICVETFKGNRSSLMLFDKEAGDLVVRSANGTENETIIGRRMELGEGIAGWAAKHRKSLFLSRNVDLNDYPGLDVEDTTLLAAMVVPIIVRNELVGVINVSTKHTDIEYDKEDLRALQVFAENAGSCIRHAEHAEWMRMTIERLQSNTRERGAQKAR